MDGTVPKIFYNFYLNFMNFLIFLNSRGPGSKFQISSGGARPLVRGGGPAPWAPRQLRLCVLFYCFILSVHHLRAYLSFRTGSVSRSC